MLASIVNFDAKETLIKDNIKQSVALSIIIFILTEKGYHGHRLHIFPVCWITDTRIAFISFGEPQVVQICIYKIRPRREYNLAYSNYVIKIRLQPGFSSVPF